MVDIEQDAKRRGIYLALFTNPEGDSCFSIIFPDQLAKNEKSNFCKLKTSFSRNFVCNNFVKCTFYNFVANSS